MSKEEDYMDLEKESEYLKKELENHSSFLSNLITRTKSLEDCLDTFIISKKEEKKEKETQNNIQNTFLNIYDKNLEEFNNKIIEVKAKIEKELITQLNNLLSNYNNEYQNDIIGLLNIKNKINEQKNKLDKDNKNIMEIIEMNTVIDSSNEDYENIYKNIASINKNNVFRVKDIFLKYCELIYEIGKIFYEHAEKVSQNIDIIEEEYKNNENIFIKDKIRFEKIIIPNNDLNNEKDKKEKNVDSNLDEEIEKEEIDHISDIDFNLDDKDKEANNDEKPSNKDENKNEDFIIKLKDALNDKKMDQNNIVNEELKEEDANDKNNDIKEESNLLIKKKRMKK